MKATVTLSLEIGKSLNLKATIEEFEKFLEMKIEESVYYTPTETTHPSWDSRVVHVTKINTTMHDEASTQDPQSL